MARARTDSRLLLIAVGVVIVVVVALALALAPALRGHRVVEPEPPPPVQDAAPEPLPETTGTRCAGPAVQVVRTHPSSVEGRTLEEQAGAALAAEAGARDAALRLLGFRGREDRERRALCRVSLRYELGDERGAAVWLVDLDAEEGERLEPQDRLSVESTGRVPLSEPAEERRLERLCSTTGVEQVKGHYSFMERYDVWGALRVTASKQRHREDGPEVEWRAWSGRPEGRQKCIVSVALAEDGRPSAEHYRIRLMEDGQHAVEPLTPRAIESIYGPRVYSR